MSISFKVLLVGGCSASGKTKFCHELMKLAKGFNMVSLSMDCAYKTPPPEFLDNILEYDFDHPSALDWDLIIGLVNQVKTKVTSAQIGDQITIDVPQYDFKTHSQTGKFQKIDIILDKPKFVVSLEGIHALHNAELCKMANVAIFIECDTLSRTIRRIVRDIDQRGRTLHLVIGQILKFVEPSYNSFIGPSSKNAPIIVNNDLTVAEFEAWKCVDGRISIDVNGNFGHSFDRAIEHIAHYFSVNTSPES